MEIDERLTTAARQLAAEKPLDRITLAEVARRAGVSWPTARRRLGSRQKLREFLTAAGGSGQPLEGTRERILAAAALVFARRGYGEATLDEVAAEAGLSKGAVYWHFASKSDLYLALLEERVRREAAVVPDRLRDIAGLSDPEAGLAAFLSQQFAVACAEPERPRLALEFASRSWDSAVRMRLASIYGEAQERLGEVFAEFQRAGAVTGDLDPAVVGVVIPAALEGLVRAWLIDPERVDLRALAPQVARILWRGVRP
ncbi:MAG: TetR family transcriptional regulator [Methanocella sp.]